MSEAPATKALLDEAQEALRQMLVAGLRNSAPLVRRCGELAEALVEPELQRVGDQLRNVAEADDDAARLAAVFRALLAVRQARLRLGGPTQAHAGAER